MSGKKRSKIKRLFPKTLLVLLVAVVLLAALNYRTLIHIYHGFYLFEPSRLTLNFRSLDQRFPSRLISAGMDVSTFDYDLRELPDYYTYNGKTRSVSQFIEDTGTTGLVVTRGDRILYEECFYGYTDTDRAIAWSVSKSIVSALIGIAIAEGYIEDINKPVTTYVSSLSESGNNGVRLLAAIKMNDFKLYLIVGLVWAFWHAPYYLYFLPESMYSTPLDRILDVFIKSPVIITIWAVMFVEMTRITRSVWPAVLMHALEDAIPNFLIFEEKIIEFNGVDANIIKSSFQKKYPRNPSDLRMLL